MHRGHIHFFGVGQGGHSSHEPSEELRSGHGAQVEVRQIVGGGVEQTTGSGHTTGLSLGHLGLWQGGHVGGATVVVVVVDVVVGIVVVLVVDVLVDEVDNGIFGHLKSSKLSCSALSAASK